MATSVPADPSSSISGGYMRQVTYTDQDGYKHVVLIRDTDPESMAPAGVPVGPPDLDLIDWEAVKRDLSNQLVENGILTYRDIQRHNSAVSVCVRACLTSKVVNIYKFTEGSQ